MVSFVNLTLSVRSLYSSSRAGSDERLEASNRAYELLEGIAPLTAPFANGKRSEHLSSFHAAKDKQLFRILATLTNPADSANARERALGKLPELTKPISTTVSEWVSQLVARCSMGDSLNAGILESCILLANACFDEEDIQKCIWFLHVVEFVVGVFPDLCNAGETFESLTTLFSKCRGTSGSLKEKVQKSGIVTLLSSILSSSSAVEAVSQLMFPGTCSSHVVPTEYENLGE